MNQRATHSRQQQAVTFGLIARNHGDFRSSQTGTCSTGTESSAAAHSTFVTREVGFPYITTLPGTPAGKGSLVAILGGGAAGCWRGTCTAMEPEDNTYTV